jgi:hypothetical protein
MDVALGKRGVPVGKSDSVPLSLKEITERRNLP